MDVSPRTGDNDVVLASGNDEKAVGIEIASVARLTRIRSSRIRLGSRSSRLALRRQSPCSQSSLEAPGAADRPFRLADRRDGSARPPNNIPKGRTLHRRARPDPMLQFANCLDTGAPPTATYLSEAGAERPSALQFAQPSRKQFRD